MNSIIITGATRGIGYECARHMAKLAPNDQIIIGCRDRQSGDVALAAIKRETGHRHLKCLPLDLGSLTSIAHFKTLLSAEKSRISALINNAGGQNIGSTNYTSDGFEETFGINHLGPFYLTLLLLPLMTTDASITFTASDAHDPAQKTGMEFPVYHTAQELAYPAATTEKTNPVGQRRYSTSKLCNILTVYELHRRLADTNIRVNAFNPGMVPGTGLARTYSPLLQFVWKNIMPVLTLFRRNVNTAKKSGRNLAMVAYDPSLRAANGQYFEETRPIQSSVDSHNRDYQTDLWRTSVKLTNSKQEDTSVRLV